MTCERRAFPYLCMVMILCLLVAAGVSNCVRETVAVYAADAVAAARKPPPNDLYPAAPLADVATKDKWVRPRAFIEGRVTLVKREDDGDVHFVVVDPKGNKVICEIIPELVTPNGHPHVDDAVQVWGVVRWDGKHGWGELHPVTGWRPKK